ncbi:glycosyl hydrolase [Streptosporangium amethystogenes]|uniref:glycosyl hydrolase n=1 Tax=Streptosporangium amethystogenes TaxID=2002 RepID=UPI0004C697CC|nr:glycosyl hydrolase [Streptosporangium amethystogenes]
MTSPRLLAALAAAVLAWGGSTATASAGTADSHTFASWTQYATGGTDLTVTADTQTPHGGAAAVKVVNATPKASNVYGGIVQAVTLAPSTTYQFSAWVKAGGLPSGSAAQFVLSPDWSVRQSFPAGSYDWTRFTWSYTTTATQSSLALRLLLQDAGALWLDDLTITAPGSSANLAANPGFEQYTTVPPVIPAELSITNPDLVFTTGPASITMTSNRPSIDWKVTDVAGQAVRSGTTAISGGVGALALPGLGNGYYGLELTTAGSDPITRRTSFAVLPPQNDNAQNVGSPFGIAWHAAALNLNQLPTMDELGVSYVRFDVSWSSVEKAKGVYAIPTLIQERFDKIVSMGLRPLVILNYRNTLYDGGKTPSTPEGIAAFAAYARFVAQQFGTAADYEVYNEYNGTGFNDGACGTTADCYLQLLKPTSEAIHAAVPGAVVAGPVLAGVDLAWLKRLFELGGLDYVDAVSVHTYARNAAPEGVTAPQLASLRALIRQYNNGQDKPLWLSETGWNTANAGVSEAQQADYLVRDLVLNIQTGVTREYWYDFLDDCVNADDKECRYGLLRDINSGQSVAAPKPAYVTYAVLTRRLAGYRPTRLEALASGAYSALFTNSSGATTRVLWATSPQAVNVTAAGAVTVTDRWGVSNTTDGSMRLALTEHPVYLSGAVSAVTSPGVPAGGEDPPPVLRKPCGPAALVYRAGYPAVAAAGESIDVTVKVDCRSQRNAEPVTVTFATPDGAHRVLVPSVSRKLSKATLSIPAPDTTGSSPYTINVLVKGEVVARLTGDVPVVDNRASVDVRPAFTAGAPGAQVVIGNASASTTLSATHVAARIGEHPVTLRKRLDIAPGRSATLPFDVTGLPGWTRLPMSAEVRFSDGITRTVNGNTALAPVLPDGTANPPVADLATSGTVVNLAGDGIAGAADLSGRMWASHTGDTITIHAVVTDDVHTSTADATSLWTKDSIQFAFATKERFEFGAARLTDGTATVYGYAGRSGRITDATAVITRDKAAKTTAYAVTLPKELIGVSTTDTVVDFSFLVNDDDGHGRTGYIEWASGIGKTKDIGQYLPLVLAE